MKIINQILIAIVFLSLFILFSTVWNFDNSSAFETVATFLSITIGFTITALSIIATSSFSKDLYKTEDKNDNSKTLLHALIGLFKTSTFVFILTIGLILTYKFFPRPKTIKPYFFIKSFPISFLVILKSNIWCFTIVSFYYFIRLVETFANFVIKTATRQ